MRVFIIIGAFLSLLNGVLSVDANACDSCTSVCSILPPPTEAFPCYQGTPSNTKTCYNTDPLIKDGSTWYCSNCTTHGYLYYVENDPVYVNMELWEKNSSSPSVAPSLSPSANPSMNPSALPSAVPTQNPPHVPSVAPTATPSAVKILAPSAAPTKQSSPIITFTSSIFLVGVANPPLDKTSQTALLNVTAESMNIPVSTVFYVATLMRTSERTGLRSLADSNLVNAVVEVQIPLSSTAYTDPTQLYNVLVADLGASVESGEFTTQLSSISTLYGATQLFHANVTDVISDALVVDDYTTNDDSKKTLSDGEIAIIASAGFLVLIIIACVYYRSHYMAPATQSDADRETASAEPSRSSTSSYRQPYYGD